MLPLIMPEASEDMGNQSLHNFCALSYCCLDLGKGITIRRTLDQQPESRKAFAVATVKALALSVTRLVTIPEEREHADVASGIDVKK